MPGPERMSRQDPLPLNQGLEAVEGPGVRVQDDLGQAGDHEEYLPGLSYFSPA